MPWVSLPQEFHPIDRAFVGQIRFRSTQPSNPRSGWIYPVMVSGFEINGSQVIPELTFSYPAENFDGVFPPDFLGALIFRGDKYIAGFEFATQNGMLVTTLDQNDFLFPGKVPWFGAAKPAGNDARRYGHVVANILSWLNEWMRNFSSGQSSGGRL